MFLSDLIQQNNILKYMSEGSHPLLNKLRMFNFPS